MPAIDFVQGSLRQSLIDSENERITRINRAWRYYLGASPAQLPFDPGDPDDNVRLNLAKTLVTKGVSWLLGADRALTFPVKDDQRASDKLEEVWPVEKRSVKLNQLAINGGICGHTFARLTEDSRVIVWDPSCVTVHWDDEDLDHVREFQYQWTKNFDTDQPEVRRQRVIEQADKTWKIVDEISRSSGGSFEVIRTTNWDHPWSPVFHCQNQPIPNEFWGEADLEKDIMDLIDAICLVASYWMRIIRHKGHPVPYATGESAKNIAQIDVSIGQFLALPNPEAKVGQLEAATPQGVKEFYGELWTAFHFATRTPPIGFGVTNLVNVAEETVELAYSPAVELTWDKRLCYGPMFIDLCSRMLELNGVENVRPSPDWAEIIPVSDTAQAAAITSDITNKIVSKETASGLRGYDWEVEQANMEEEAQAALEEAQKTFDAGGIGMPITGTRVGANGGAIPEQTQSGKTGQ